MGEKKSMTLYVPNNIRTNMELVDGFGLKELGTTAIVTGVSVAIAFIIYGLTQEVYQGMLLILITAAATFMAVRKNDMNQSVIDMMRLSLRFTSSQKKYKYEYKPKNWGDL